MVGTYVYGGLWTHLRKNLSWCKVEDVGFKGIRLARERMSHFEYRLDLIKKSSGPIPGIKAKGEGVGIKVSELFTQISQGSTELMIEVYTSRDIDHVVLQTSALWLSGIRSLSTKSKRYQQQWKCLWCALAMKIIFLMLADTDDICAASWARKKENGSCCRITKKTNLASPLIRPKDISRNAWQESVHED